MRLNVGCGRLTQLGNLWFIPRIGCTLVQTALMVANQYISLWRNGKRKILRFELGIILIIETTEECWGEHVAAWLIVQSFARTVWSFNSQYSSAAFWHFLLPKVQPDVDPTTPTSSHERLHGNRDTGSVKVVHSEVGWSGAALKEVNGI